MAQILIVEDEADFRKVLVTTLVGQGHSVIEADDGSAVPALVRDNKVDLVLLDVVMPHVDGIKVIMNLRETKNPVPIIAMTGGHPNTELYLKIARMLGAERVLTKPFHLTDLLQRIREVLPA